MCVFPPGGGAVMQVYAQRGETGADSTNLRIKGGFSKIIGLTYLNIFVIVPTKAQFLY